MRPALQSGDRVLVRRGPLASLQPGLIVVMHDWPESLQAGSAPLLMQSLYECGRRADALRLYRAGREMITTELGLEPSFELQRMHQHILAATDPAAGAQILVVQAGRIAERGTHAGLLEAGGLYQTQFAGQAANIG